MGDNVKDLIGQSLIESIAVKQRICESMLPDIEHVSRVIIHCYRSCGKTVFYGNGGSFAVAQHLAAEFVGQFKLTRSPLPSLALGNPATITAIGNDFDYDKVFERQIEAFVNRVDVVIGISTSGNSPNIVEAIKKAKELKAITVGLTGNDGGALALVANMPLVVPSDDTARIQEAHITIGHIIVDVVERALGLCRWM